MLPAKSSTNSWRKPETLAMAAAEKYLLPIISISIVSLLLLLYALSSFTSTSYLFLSHLPSTSHLRRGPTQPPSFAYFISGSNGDSSRILRLLLSIYHPRNQYLLHLAPDASDSERARLAVSVRLAIPAARAFGNVDVMGRPNQVTPTGSSALAATLHAAALMLRIDGGWDWFVTLSARDYPLVTQDDLIHVFSSVPRDLNFIDHTSDLGWKEDQRVKPIIVDAAIYLARRSSYFQATEKRKTPDAFRFFTGSPWVILSRPFIEYCILGWENLPRTLLMYFTNALLAQEAYFHSVACNAPGFPNTTVNNDLRYMTWDNPPGMEPHFLNITDYEKMIESGVPFARQFHKDDRVLDEIDEKILGRRNYRVAPGGWCSAKNSWWSDPCSEWGNVNSMKPGPQSDKFGWLMRSLLTEWNTRNSSCK